MLDTPPDTGKCPRKHRRKYRPEYDRQAQYYCLLGATQEDLARFFGVVRETIMAWEKHIASFHQACDAGRVPADGKVMASLYKRTQPYDVVNRKITWVRGIPHEVTDTQHVPADPRAIELWLKLRKPWLGTLADTPPPAPTAGVPDDEDLVELIMQRVTLRRGRKAEAPEAPIQLRALGNGHANGHDHDPELED